MSEETNGEVQLYPVWKEAVAKFLRAGFQYDQVVPFSWFFQVFGLTEPTPGMILADGEKVKLAFLQSFKPMRDELLTGHQIDLVNERSVGYRVMLPKQQTKVAYEDGIAEVKKAMRRMTRRLVHVNHAMLTVDEQRENADHLAQSSKLAEMFRRQRKLPVAQP